jgi:copper oxidase (laccase) domain-containing protein
VAEGAEASACMIAMFDVVRFSSVRIIVVLSPFIVKRCYAVEEQIKE